MVFSFITISQLSIYIYNRIAKGMTKKYAKSVKIDTVVGKWEELLQKVRKPTDRKINSISPFT